MTATDSCRPGLLERPACFEIVPMATRSRRQPTNPHRPQPRRPASSRTRNCDGAITRAYGEIVHRPGFWPGRAWSDLLFTMSDNTHRSEPHGRTHQANASVRIDAFGRATSLPTQQCERRRRRSAHTRYAVRQSFGATRASMRRPFSEGDPIKRPPAWWSQTGSNRRPPACKAGALPAELWPHQKPALGIASQRPIADL